MQINLKSAPELAAMRTAGKLAAEVLDMIGPHVKAGVTTEQLDQICHQYMVETQGTIPATLGYKGYTKSICTSVNHVICHGIPGPKVLKTGDIINIDVTVIKDGFHGDNSRMYYVGEPSILARRLCDLAREAMCAGIRMVKPGVKLAEVGRTIQKIAEAERFSVVREYCGHGIGREFHEDPQVLHYYEPSHASQQVVLTPGMVFTIEPMINAGDRRTRLMPDGWTVVTRDHSLSAQWEHTVAVTDTGYEVLTVSPLAVIP
jgi:methionyl aminopeptidase